MFSTRKLWKYTVSIQFSSKQFFLSMFCFFFLCSPAIVVANNTINISAPASISVIVCNTFCVCLPKMGGGMKKKTETTHRAIIKYLTTKISYLPKDKEETDTATAYAIHFIRHNTSPDSSKKRITTITLKMCVYSAVCVCVCTA